MKRFLIYTVFVILLAAGVGYLFESKSSYVLVSYESYAIETSLWFFSFAVLVLVFILYQLSKLLMLLYKPKQRFENWALDRRVAASKRDFYQALIDFELGAWDKALKRFKAAAENLERPLVALLYAARTAQKLNRADYKEAFLKEALHLEPKSALAVGLVRAELLQLEGDVDAAKKVLSSLQQASPKNVQVAKLLETIELSSTSHQEVPAESVNKALAL